MSEPKFTKGPWEQDRFGSLNSPDGNVIQVWGLGIAHGPRTPASEANAALLKASPDLYEACQEQHKAIDYLFARLAELDHTFFPSKSGQPWQAIVLGNAALKKAVPK
jgi:hypothetical protein